MAEQQRNVCLDVLRGLAVLLVLGVHMPKWPDNVPAFLNWLFWIWQQIGGIGVDLFFVLSGFLVSGLLFREFKKYGNIQLKRFLIRRGLKIYPAFYFFLATTLVLKFIYSKPLTTAGVVGEVLFLQNYVGRIWNHTWTLAVEEHFYLLIGLLLTATFRRNSEDPFSYIPKLFILSAVLLLTARFVVVFTVPDFRSQGVIISSHLRIDSLLAGVCLSYLYHFRSNDLRAWIANRRWIQVIAIVMVALGAGIKHELWAFTVSYTMLYMGFGTLLICCIDFQQSRQFLVRWIVKAISYIGIHSYSIYLWHMAAGYWGAHVIVAMLGRNLSTGEQWVTYFVFAISFGIVSAEAIEIPIVEFRNRFFPSRETKSPPNHS